MNRPEKRVLRTEYVVMRRAVSETWEGVIRRDAWTYIGDAPTIEKCYEDVIGPDYPADYDGHTIFRPRVRLRPYDRANPHLKPYDQGAIFEKLVYSDGGWTRGKLIEYF